MLRCSDGPVPGSLHKRGKVRSFLCVLLVFPWVMKALFFVLSILVHQQPLGGLLDGHSFPKGGYGQLSSEYLLVPGIWLGVGATVL